MDDCEILDVLGEFNNAVKAERKGVNILILRKLDEPRQMFKYKAHYEIEYRWINPETGGVLGTEYTYWNSKDVDLSKTLFSQFNLIS